jgi:hypothetical protein
MSGWMLYLACGIFKFDRPEMYEGGAVECRIEENGPKLCGRTICVKGSSATE